MNAQSGLAMIQFYEPLPIYNSKLDLNVIYCSADAQEVDEFVIRHAETPEDKYKGAVLGTFIDNWNELRESLKSLAPNKAHKALEQLYNGCVMINPNLDGDTWDELVSGGESIDTPPDDRDIQELISVEKFRGLKPHLESKIIGQSHVIDAVCEDLKRAVSGLDDLQQPLGVFLFAGSTGSGKSATAKAIHEYLFSDFGPIIRIDCGEYQQKQDAQKLYGAPPGYVMSDEGGHLTNQLKKNNKAVVLFDEIEKAHNDICHTLLRAFDEGTITDNKGQQYSFANTIIIMTTNLGMQKTLGSVSNARVGFHAKSGHIDDGVQPDYEDLKNNVNEAIKDFFPSEFLNRIDKTIVFNTLTEQDIRQIAQLELDEVQRKLSKQGVTLNYNNDVIDALTASGIQVAEGARRVTRQRREKVENAVSDAILNSQQFTNGSVIDLVYDGKYKAKFTSE